MKNSRVLLLAGFVTLLPVLAADEKKEKPTAAPAVQVVLKRISLPSGETLDEVSTTSAVIDKEVEGKLSINVGTTEQPKFWTVEFDAEGDHVIQVSVSDTSRMRQSMTDGTSWVSPVELFQVIAPFVGEGTVTIYRTKSESLTLEVSPVAAAVGANPEPE